MEETFKTDIINGRVINWDKLSDEELNALKAETERQEQEITQNILNVFSCIVDE